MVRVARLFAVCGSIVMLTAGCGSDPPPAAKPTSGSATPTASVSPRSCPGPGGGLCLGLLQAGTYTTQVFTPTLTYTVSEGWTNFEDLLGNFLLVPARGNLPGVNAGTSDFIGIYSDVQAEHLDCIGEQVQSGVGTSPEAIARWITQQDGLIATDPSAVEVGGLNGVVLDVRLADGAGIHCPGYEPAYYSVITGVGISSLDHGVIPGLTWRLYLLDFDGGSLAIEVNDVAGGGRHLAEYTSLVQDLQFST